MDSIRDELGAEETGGMVSSAFFVCQRTVRRMYRKLNIAAQK